MDWSRWTYLGLTLGSISLPLIFSAHPAIRFHVHHKAVFAAIVITATPLLIWDVLFTTRGVWGFSQEYHLGLEILGLPLEEVLFFLTIPYSCLFIWHLMRQRWPWLLSEILVRMLGWMVAGLSLSLALSNAGRDYTLIVGLSLALVMAFITWRRPGLLRLFFPFYLVHLIPFFLVNGLLTVLPVVWYSDSEILGIRIGSIPLEDTLYSMLLMLGNVWLFETFSGNNK